MKKIISIIMIITTALCLFGCKKKIENTEFSTNFSFIPVAVDDTLDSQWLGIYISEGKSVKDIWINVDSISGEVKFKGEKQKDDTYTEASVTTYAFECTITEDDVKKAKEESDGWINITSDWTAIKSMSYYKIYVQGEITLNEILFRTETYDRSNITVKKAYFWYYNDLGKLRSDVFTEDDMNSLSIKTPLNLIDEWDKFNR